MITEVQADGSTLVVGGNLAGSEQGTSHPALSLVTDPGPQKVDTFVVIAQEEAMAETAFARTMRAGEKITDIDSARAAISVAVDEGKEVARRAVRRGIRAVEDLEADALQEVRRHPRTTVAIAFGMALSAGLLLGWLFGRARR